MDHNLEKGRPKMLPITSEQKWAIAIHESGHAVAACELGFGLKRRGVELIGQEGISYPRSPGLRSGIPEVRQRSREGSIVVLLAGPVAECRVTEDLLGLYGDVEDIAAHIRELLPHKNHFVRNASDLGTPWGAFWAMIYTLATCTEEKKAIAELDRFPGLARIEMPAFRLLWPLAQQTHAIIDRNWSKVEEVSNELIKHGRLSGDEVEQIMSHHSASP